MKLLVVVILHSMPKTHGSSGNERNQDLPKKPQNIDRLGSTSPMVSGRTVEILNRESSTLRYLGLSSTDHYCLDSMNSDSNQLSHVFHPN